MLNRLNLSAFACAVLALGIGGCDTTGPTSASGKGKAGENGVTVHLAYFPNVTHAAALTASGRGTFQSALASSGATIEEKTFTAGPAEIEALFAGAVDVGYIGPGPALNGYLKSGGEALRIVAGASSGGAGLVARADSIKTVADLANQRVAVPQVGGTQDISLKHALSEAGLAPKAKNGTVDVVQYAPADAVARLAQKEIDAAWLPEPWVSRVEKDGTARIVLDERDRWPNRKFATTVIIVRTAFLKEHPDLVQKILEAHVDTVAWMKANPDAAQKIVGERIAKITTKSLPDDVLKAALARTDIISDPLKESVLTFADWSQALGYQREGRAGLKGLFEIGPLNTVLAARKQPAIP